MPFTGYHNAENLLPVAGFSVPCGKFAGFYDPQHRPDIQECLCRSFKRDLAAFFDHAP